MLNELDFDENNPATEARNEDPAFANNTHEIPFSLAEVLYHEMKAHIDLHGDDGKDHDRYGKSTSGVFYRLPASGTPAGEIRSQLWNLYIMPYIGPPTDDPSDIPNPNPVVPPNIASRR